MSRRFDERGVELTNMPGGILGQRGDQGGRTGRVVRLVQQGDRTRQSLLEPRVSLLSHGRPAKRSICTERAVSSRERQLRPVR